MIKKDIFDADLQELAEFARMISHPARLAILKYLAETQTCISGDISSQLPLSRTTVSQHLKELKSMGLIQGEIDGLKINYCLCKPKIAQCKTMFNTFFEKIEPQEIKCDCKA